MENCIFCKMVQGEIPCYKVWENDHYLAFLTIQPHRPGHTLLIPKKHEDYFFDMDETDMGAITVAAKPIAQALKSAFNPASGKVALVLMGMGVPHVHLHLIPLDQETDIDTVTAYAASKEELTQVQRELQQQLQQ